MTDTTMASDAWRGPLQSFLRQSRWHERGAVITDLDGTAVHEREGVALLSKEIEFALKAVHDRGRAVIVNSLRFPLSVIRVFGQEWHRVTGAAIPLVSLKGAQVGQVVRAASGEFAFEAFESFVLGTGEIDDVAKGVEGWIGRGVEELLVFFYRRDWRQGEIIWTPSAERIPHVARKYRSASSVFSGPAAALREALLAEPVCMVFMLIDVPADRLMAYQHTDRSSFFTQPGIDKRHGAISIARHLGVSLADSLGAGDAPPDNFLAECGFAVIVGPGALESKGTRATVRVADPPELGRLLAALAAG